MNSFGTTTKQFPLVDARCVREHRRRFRRDLFPELKYANSYYNVAGRWSDVGWLLLDRNSYNQLDPYSKTLQLVIGDFVNTPVTVSNLSIVTVKCVTYGLASDVNAIYLLQVTNNLGILRNQWFQYPVDVQYNVRAPAYSSVNENYYSGSLTGTNSTDAWTWTGMVQDLWNKSGGLLGTYPGLPYTPDTTPEGFSFVGVPLLDALSNITDYLGMNIAGNYPNFSIVVPGAADTAYSALLTKYAATTSPNFCLQDSMAYSDIGSGRVPGQMVVYFPRRNQVYGSEEVDRYDSPQWQNTPAFTVTLSAPATFASAVGVGHLWSSFTVRYDQEGNPILEDVLKAQVLATDLVRNYFNIIHRGLAGQMRDVYAGALPFTTGSMVDGVRWYNTGYSSSGTLEDRYCGWQTEVIRGQLWPEVRSYEPDEPTSGPV